MKPIPRQTNGADDYARVRKAIQFLSEQRQAQPGLGELAAHLRMDQTACQKLFKRWCGLTPKDFLQAITLDHARNMLDRSASVMEAAHDSGLSGTGRLHDLCISHEALTPGAIKHRGSGVSFAYGFHSTPFGPAVALVTPHGLAGLSFANEDNGETLDDVLSHYRERWPAGQFIADEKATEPFLEQIFGQTLAGGRSGRKPQPVRIVLIGTDFEIRVWQALLNVPVAGAASYSMIAKAIGQPAASRAVGTAIGHNPISFVVPCHRVLRRDGGIGGYRWGVTRKKAIIGWEFGHRNNQVGDEKQ